MKTHLVRKFITAACVCLSLSASAKAQLSSSAYRVLGQLDLRQNGINGVQGVELFGPSSVAVDARDGQVHLYIADAMNSRVLGWQDVQSYQAGDVPGIVLGQPGLAYSGPLGIGVKGFNSPVKAFWLSIAVDPTTGNVYVADYGNSRVLRFPAPFQNTSRVEPDAVYGQANFSSRNPNPFGITKSSLNGPRSLAFDSVGNLWVADTGNHRILRFNAGTLNDPNPEADLIIGQKDFNSGNSNRGSGGVSASGFDTPIGLAVDAQNNLYVADFNNTRVLKFAAPLNSDASAVAVLGEANFTTRGVPVQASAVTLAGPTGVAVDAAGKLYVAVPNDNRVLVFPPGATSGSPAKDVLGQTNFSGTLANTGAFPLASAGTLFSPNDVKVDASGNIYVTDTANNRVVQFPPSNPPAANVATRVWGQSDFVCTGPNRIKPGSINGPYKIAIDYSQTPFAFYVSDTNNNRVLVWKDATAVGNGAAADLVIGQPDFRTGIANVDTRGGAIPSRTSLSAPKGIVVDSSGNLYVADSGNHRVLRYPRPVSQSGRIAPDVVLGQADFNSAGSAAINAASLKSPSGVIIGPDGDLFIADSGNNRVLEFAAGVGNRAAAIRVYGQTDFLTGGAPSAVSAVTLASPQGLFVDASFNLYVADYGSNRVLIFPNVRNAPPMGASAAVVIGQDQFNSTSGGKGTRLNGPADVAVDSGGHIYISDNGNHRVLIFSSLLFLPNSGGTATGVVGQSGLSGTAPNWNSPDGLATPEGLYRPVGLYLDRRDTLYVGDVGNNRVVHFLKAAAAVNAATLQASVPVAQGGLVTLFGASLADNPGSASGVPWPATLQNRQVVINDGPAAPLLFVGPGQINFQMPWAAPIGSGRLAVRYADSNELLASAKITVSAASPGFFTATQDGKGQGAVFNEDGTLNGPTSPAARGRVIQLFGTGQGPVVPAVPDGAAAPSDALVNTAAVPTSDGNTCLNNQPSVCVAIGSTFGDIQFSGLAPGLVGIWQVNVKIPVNALTGNAVPVRALINGVPSNIISVAIK